ncbi:4a-hydroxytetrahydrobiopterin dehydratase [Actinocorallia populi]|uniref:4a-hydroxytetrahydrobiopterin dehydratase n=1 Tax=Actinocorallia populi TaxID=2079200 RepID=UPI000D091146|nr:4a-hydroxytetrahydrobiopterin dehydratase [Actinocorallia populi]
MGQEWENTGHALVREFVFSDFAGAMAFVNRVAQIAEEQGHHPDIAIRWNKVTLTLSTHTSGGLTDKDFRLAEAVDGL